MPEPHKRVNRHPKSKTAYRVTNWHKYDKALRDRGDITLWPRHEVIDAWTAPQTGKRGGQRVYADIAIETARTLRLLFHLPLRQTEGLLCSVLILMDVALPCPHVDVSGTKAGLRPYRPGLTVTCLRRRPPLARGDCRLLRTLWQPTAAARSESLCGFAPPLDIPIRIA